MNNQVLILGDIHGESAPIKNLCKRNKIKKGENSYLILLGDAGLNFFLNEKDSELKNSISKSPFTYFCIRGNHEERPSILMEKYPDSWHTETFWGGMVYVENEFPKIKYACDYPCVYEIPYPSKTLDDNLQWKETTQIAKTLVIPGAYSIDKNIRIAKEYPWFALEQLSLEEMTIGMELACEEKYFDLILSHAAPQRYSGFMDRPAEDTTSRYLDLIEERVGYHAWCWGHLHKNAEYFPSTEGSYTYALYNQYALSLQEIIEDCVSLTHF